MAVSNNYELFVLIDVKPKNGVVTWKEYHSYFLKKRGFSRKYVDKHDERRHKGLQRALKGILTMFLCYLFFFVVNIINNIIYV